MKPVLIAAFFIIFHISPGSCHSGDGDSDFDSDGNSDDIADKSYLIIIPRVFRGGTTVNVGVNIFGNVSCDVSVKLYDSSNYRITSRAEGRFHPNEAGELKVKVPEASVRRIGATVCGEETGRKEIYHSAPTKKIFIQTDKPIYKPGQKVLIRIIYVDSELKPAGNKVSSVVIQEPSGSKIMEWTDIKLEDGIANLDLLLSKEPVLGRWKITATIEVLHSSKIVAVKQIEIKKYVLPKFELSLRLPSYLSWDQRKVPVSICARYSYGKDVTGRLEATFCYKHIWRSRETCINEIKNITGCEEFEVVELLHRTKKDYYYYYGWYLHTKAIFTEIATGIKRIIESTSSRMLSSSKRMSLVGLPEQFKPGFPLKFKVKISYVDGKPVTDGKVNVWVSRRRFYYHGSRKLFEETYSVKNSLVHIALKDMPHDTETLEFRISYNRNEMSKYVTLRAWYSPSLSYLQLIKTRMSTTKVGGEGSIKVMYTYRNEEETEIDFNYKILCKGNLVLSGVTQQSPSSKHSKSRNKRYQPLRTTPAYDYNPTHPFISIPKPTIKEFELKFNVTQRMVPSCRILVYYIRSDKETVGDSIVYDVEDKLENQVSIDFVEKQKKPGEKTKIVLKAKPGSRIAISALDKSVLLLRNANDVKKSELLGILNRQDVGRTGRYDSKCWWSWNKPHVADVSEAFNAAGVTFLSNLNIFTQPCHRDQPKFYEDSNKPVTTAPPAINPWWNWWKYETTEFVTTPVPTEPPETTEVFTTPAPTEPPETTEVFRIPAATEKAFTEAEIPIATTSTFVKRKTIKKVKVRKNFPETWLWTEIKLNDTSGMQRIEVQVPDTITSWVASGFAMSSVYGMAVAHKSTLKAFQPFFVQMSLPYSVIRGEEVPVTVTVFNYLSSCVPMKLEISRKSKDYKVTSLYLSKLCVCGDDGKSEKFKIIPFKLGHIPLTVKAITSEANLCPKSTVYAADAVTRKLLVEPEGIKQEYTKGTFFCPNEGTYNETIDLSLPRDIVAGSVLPKITVSGDVMGPALVNLDGLLAMPYGCGEQNMAKFAPNIYIMDYLANTDQVTQKIKDDAIRFMNSGYQRELTYKRRSGSYSIFGNSDRQGSMMLTAFVVRSFARARKYIFIDENEIKHSIRWFTLKQKPSGCFPKYGKVFDKSLQGGLNSELAITSYVTIALLEAGLDNKTSLVTKALDCITKKLNNTHDSYTTSLVTYTLVMADHPKAGIMINRLKKKAVTTTAGQLYWSAKSDELLQPTDVPEYYSIWNYQPPAADVEMTGYALMSYLKHKESIKDVTEIIKWLSKQRNNYGGFASTQDTCVALQALSEVAQKFYGSEGSKNLNIQVNIKDIFGHNFKLTEDNKLILQRVEIPSNALPNKLQIVATGSGCSLLQATVKYYVPVPEEIPAFKVNVSVHRRKASAEEETTDCYPLKLKINAEWLKEDVSNMAIVDIKLVSGFEVNEDLLQEKLDQALNQVGVANVFKRYEIDGQNILLYFDEINKIHFSLDIIQSALVKKTKPGVVRVYDYYNPDNQAKVMYNITEEDCYGDKIETECPKCVSVDDFEEFFDKNINCSVYLMRAKSINGLIKVRKAYIKADRAQNYAILPYEMPEFCSCDEIYNGVSSLVFGQSDYFRKDGQKTSIVFNSGTTIAKWSGKKMKKIFRKKMWLKIYRRCKRLARG